MVLEHTKPLTAEEFERFTERPENADKLFEFIGGEIYEVPMSVYLSSVSVHVMAHLGQYVFTNAIGHLTGKGGGYCVFGERYAPSVGFISKARLPVLPRQGYSPCPPNLAVEIAFSDESPRHLRIKTMNYLAAGTTFWLGFPDEAIFEVYIPGQPVRILGIEDVLEAEDILPGFKLPVKAIFRKKDEKKEEN